MKRSIQSVKIPGEGIENASSHAPFNEKFWIHDSQASGPAPHLEHHDVWGFRKHGGVEPHSDSRVEHQKSLTSRWIRMLNVVSVFWLCFL